jgi:hypothetical protein
MRILRQAFQSRVQARFAVRRYGLTATFWVVREYIYVKETETSAEDITENTDVSEKTYYF